LAKIDGFISASVLRRFTAEGTEFLVVTTWQSIEAIRQFAGESAQTAVVPPEVQAMMVEYDREVAHYEIVEEHSR
jgi:heme-degrading monooxygenase HmoA